MLTRPLRDQPAAPGQHLVLYDGVCGLCNGVNRFILARDLGQRFHFASLQSAAAAVTLAPFGVNPRDLDTIYVVANYQTAAPTLLRKSRAVLFALRQLGWPWRAAGLLAILPDRMRDTLYDLVARYRYRLFGRHDQCPIPPLEHRRRFIDVASLPPAGDSRGNRG
jgi:predicted DCC family thiol-disulfide oxidoreductase YuxK